ncbi:phage tail family protein [Streptomyces sp. NBC_00264]|uniref:phage distal tail protein n=1 Tax=unclassified Streptomyces TaxID=2593676 RepID=UPI00224E5C04|nr:MULTISPECIES: phage tail domain-containing protein [unclassified Streptomyces]MCX5161867.1 phage tail family protein [Streptomyces sp. NBC_00305]MCX5220390.1 phage tail family protein [Streptomyces sp. NBC_00264]
MAIGDRMTRPGHVQYGDMLFGPGTPYRWRTVTGWEDLPALDSGTVPRSDTHGAFPGQLLAQARTITLEGLMVRAPRATIGAAVGALSASTAPAVDERPLVVWLDERGPLLTFARATRRAIPAGPGYTVGTITGGAIEFVATDPRRYGLTEHVVSAGLPAAEPGLAWPLAWPLTFGAPGSTGSLSVSNAGDAATHPVVEFRGPITRPALTALSTGDVLEYDLPLAAGDTLTVDTRAGTVVLNGTASRLDTATSRSVPEQTFTLAPGTTDLTFRAAPGSSDPAASATVRYRSAYW